MTDHHPPQVSNSRLFSQLQHCTLPFTTSSSPTANFDYNHLVSLLTNSQLQLDAVAELLDCIISLKEQQSSPLLSIVKSSAKWDKEIIIKEDDDSVMNAFKRMCKDMKERMEEDRRMVEEVALPLLRDGWRVVGRAEGALLVDVSPHRLLSPPDNRIILPEICVIGGGETPGVTEQRHLSMTITVTDTTTTYSMHKVCPSPGKANSPFHAHLWSRRDTLLQEMLLKGLVDEQMAEDRPMYSKGTLTITIVGSILVQFSMSDSSLEEGEGVLREMRKHFISSKGQTCGWTECRQRLLDGTFTSQ